MAELLDDCVVCKLLKDDKIEKKGTHCSIVKVGSVSVAALNHHEVDALPEALGEAFELLDYSKRKGFVSEFMDAPGHWAVKLMPTNGLPTGKSEGKAG